LRRDQLTHLFTTKEQAPSLRKVNVFRSELVQLARRDIRLDSVETLHSRMASRGPLRLGFPKRRLSSSIVASPSDERRYETLQSWQTVTVVSIVHDNGRSRKAGTVRWRGGVTVSV
jgi:hypothetical protein